MSQFLALDFRQHCRHFRLRWSRLLFGPASWSRFYSAWQQIIFNYRHSCPPFLSNSVQCPMSTVHCPLSLPLTPTALPKAKMNKTPNKKEKKKKKKTQKKMEKWENNFETRTNEWEPQVISTAPATTGAQQYKAYRPGSQSSLVFGGDHKIWLSILFGKKKKKGKDRR